MSLYEWLMNPAWRRRWQLFWMIVGVLLFIVGLWFAYNLFTTGWIY